MSNKKNQEEKKKKHLVNLFWKNKKYPKLLNDKI
jgi:hypothetical protein